LEAASQLAATHGVWHLRELKSLLQTPAAQDQFQLIQQHPLIRDLSHYQALIPDCFTSLTPNQHTNQSIHELPDRPALNISNALIKRSDTPLLAKGSNAKRSGALGDVPPVQMKYPICLNHS